MPAYYYSFSYPAPLTCSEGKKRKCEAIGEKIVEQLKLRKQRRSRWRPREG
ncbi:hypothetical protein I41_01540 [Lacipirellula limnantheis]|uniref:Uncharacterized protein n=2 Tax=Lacipirellula limnantheis TaxID=2528024 RepID=A0A517TRK8_9BACT|nr:hypothetical protein I41_01540 [Lacipirellula limnantheis]